MRKPILSWQILLVLLVSSICYVDLFENSFAGPPKAPPSPGQDLNPLPKPATPVANCDQYDARCFHTFATGLISQRYFYESTEISKLSDLSDDKQQEYLQSRGYCPTTMTNAKDCIAFALNMRANILAKLKAGLENSEYQSNVLKYGKDGKNNPEDIRIVERGTLGNGEEKPNQKGAQTNWMQKIDEVQKLAELGYQDLDDSTFNAWLQAYHNEAYGPTDNKGNPLPVQSPAPRYKTIKTADGSVIKVIDDTNKPTIGKGGKLNPKDKSLTPSERQALVMQQVGIKEKWSDQFVSLSKDAKALFQATKGTKYPAPHDLQKSAYKDTQRTFNANIKDKFGGAGVTTVQAGKNSPKKGRKDGDRTPTSHAPGDSDKEGNGPKGIQARDMGAPVPDPKKRPIVEELQRRQRQRRCGQEKNEGMKACIESADAEALKEFKSREEAERIHKQYREDKSLDGPAPTFAPDSTQIVNVQSDSIEQGVTDVRKRALDSTGYSTEDLKRMGADESDFSQ